MRLLKNFVAVASLLCGVVPVASQSTIKIEGYVLAESGKPLQGANITVVGTGFGTAADARGYYAIENLFAGEVTLRVGFVGYRPERRDNVVVRKDLTTTANFKLRQKVIALDEIVVEAPAERRPSSGFQQRITTSQIQKSGARTVGEILVDVPGVDIIDDGGGGGRKRISIRGSNANQVLVLVDGVPLNDPLTGDVDLNLISLSGVEEIRVLKGGNSSSYGSGALGGVVEIISRQHPVDEIRVSGHFGRFGAFGIRPVVAGNAGNLSYFLSLENLTEDGDFPYTYQRPDGTTAGENRLNADFTSQNYFGKVILDAAHHSLQLQAHFYKSNRGLPGLVFGWTPFADAQTRRRILRGSHTFQENKWRTQLDFSQHLNETEFQNALPADAPLRFRTVPPYHNKYQILSHRGAFESTYRFGNEHLLLFQTSLQHDDFKDENLLSPIAGPVRQTDNLTYGAAVRNEWQLPKPAFLSRVVLNHALRFDLTSFESGNLTRSEQQISPGAGLLLSRNQGWLLNLRANWGRSFRVPTFADLFFQDFRVRGNADLEPEESWDFDAGLQLGFPWLGWLELSGTYFRHRVENLIVWELGSFATWQPFNTDALLKGLELSGRWETWENRVHLIFSHVISNAVDKSGRRTTQDKSLTYRPEHTTKVGLELNFEKLVLTYHRRMVGKRYVTAANTVSMPAYAVDDVTILAGHRFQSLKLNLKFSIFNLFGERFEIVERSPIPGRYWRAELETVF